MGQGTAGGAGRDPGGAGPKGRGRTRRVGDLRSAPCAPDGAHPLPLAGLDAYRRAVEFRVVADRVSRRETVSGRQLWAGPAQKRRSRQASKEDVRAQNTGLASTERGRQGGRNGKGSREKQL